MQFQYKKTLKRPHATQAPSEDDHIVPNVSTVCSENRNKIRGEIRCCILLHGHGLSESRAGMQSINSTPMPWGFVFPTLWFSAIYPPGPGHAGILDSSLILSSLPRGVFESVRTLKLCSDASDLPYQSVSDVESAGQGLDQRLRLIQLVASAFDYSVPIPTFHLIRQVSLALIPQ